MISSVYFVELYVAWMGLQEAVVHLKASALWLEGDASSGISAIASSSSSNTPQQPILQDILCWKTKRASFILSHASRNANRAADFAAKSTVQ